MKTTTSSTNFNRNAIRWHPTSAGTIAAALFAMLFSVVSATSAAEESQKVDLNPDRISELMTMIYAGKGTETATEEAEQFGAFT